MYGEMIEFDGGIFGMALNLEQDPVGAVVLGDYLNLTRRVQKLALHRPYFRSASWSRTWGRVVDALGKPIDGKGPINAKLTDAVEK